MKRENELYGSRAADLGNGQIGSARENRSAGLTLLPGWQNRLQEAQPAAEDRPKAVRILPRDPRYYQQQTIVVAEAAAAHSMLEFIRQRPISVIGLDTEFRYDRPGIAIRKKTAYDSSSLRPLVLSLAPMEFDGQGSGIVYPFVVDLRVPDVHLALSQLFRLPYCFAGHYAHADLLCLFKAGLNEPALLWDTWVCEKALNMGHNHKKYKLKAEADDADQTRAAEETEEQEEFSYRLVPTCTRYGIIYPFAGDKERLQRSFLEHPLDAPFAAEQIAYTAADAIAVASLYSAQIQAATRTGILQHLIAVEMPWVSTNARMQHYGVHKDQALCRRVEQAALEHRDRLNTELARQGIANAASFHQLKQFFESRGLLHLFRRNGHISFDKDMLAELEDHHPVIPMLRAVRKINYLLESRILTDDFVGADGRIHPNYTQLGTHTGRQASWGPNILGLGRIFRPLFVALLGRGLGEVDLSQIEIGIAAAVYHDACLVEMFNTGDVYSSMAQYFFRDELDEADRSAPGNIFKKKYPSLRAKMKVCTLALIYGITPYGLGLRLNTSKAEAVALLERFMAMFPELRRALEETPQFGALCGYVSTSTGLRRHRARPSGSLSNWERNWMTNHPVQGSAAVVFKVAGNRLDKLYRRYDARLLVPLHDAYLFEAPLDTLQEVASLTGRVLCETVQEYFPVLQPRVETNIEYPACWNKDGRFDSVERWMEDPTFSMG